VTDQPTKTWWCCYYTAVGPQTDHASAETLPAGPVDGHRDVARIKMYGNTIYAVGLPDSIWWPTEVQAIEAYIGRCEAAVVAARVQLEAVEADVVAGHRLLERLQ
jgi:hypothetical protein